LVSSNIVNLINYIWYHPGSIIHILF